VDTEEKLSTSNMKKHVLRKEDYSGMPRHALLDPVLDSLLDNGNELSTAYRWGSNPTGYFAVLKYPIDFDLVEARFELPTSVVLNRDYGEIDYGFGTVIIRSE
jgi:hypothetical protein